MQIIQNLISKRYSKSFITKNNFNKYNDAIKELYKILNNNPDYKVNIDICPLCKYDISMLISEVDRYNLPLNLLICQKCGFIFSQFIFTNKFIRFYYSSIYNKFKSHLSAEENFLNRIKEDTYSKMRIDYIKQNLNHFFANIKLVIEPGCNDGCNLYHFKKSNIKVLGCDFDESRIAVGKKYGIEILKGDISKIVELNIKADLIILSHLIAHIDNLDFFLSDIKKILKPSGYLYIETPGLKWWLQPSIISRKKNGFRSSNNFLNFIQFEFFYIFELFTLKKIMKKYNFEFLCGDEQIRSIFKNKTTNHKLKLNDSNYNKNKPNEVLNYIQSVEKSYKSWITIIPRYIKEKINQLIGK